MAAIEIEIEKPTEKKKKKKRAITKLDKKRQSKKTKTTAGWAKFLTSVANDDILSAIFTRLPNSRAALTCAGVCTRWHSLISQIDFKRRRFVCHDDSAPAFTILFRGKKLMNRRYQWLCGEIFSDESAMLHGPLRSDIKPRKKSHSYLNFLPRNSIVLSSCKDLLLVQLPGPRHLCICNPLTRQWDPLPDPLGIVDPATGGFFDADSRHYSGSLVCDFDSDDQSLKAYTVVLINNLPSEFCLEVVMVVFRSESGKWDDHVVRFPREESFSWLPNTLVDASDGIIYMLKTSENQYDIEISGFDPRDPKGISFFDIGLPQGFINHLAPWNLQTKFGVIKGKMRIWQSYFDQRSEKFVHKVWQRNGKYEDWVSVIDVRLEPSLDEYNGLGYYSLVIALHPNDDDVFFFLNTYSPGLRSYNIGSGRYAEINIGSVLFDSNVFTLEHPRWPTQIPLLTQT